jgi:tetraacyldisaccharide 4'-kinase
MRPPDFWYPAGPEATPLTARLLKPLASLYDRIARARAGAVTPYRAAVPVVCVGNLTAGGTGKTPIALALASALAARGIAPVFLSRGYGGRIQGPRAVDPAHHSAAEVGDEPLLLARAHPTIVSRDRPQGAEAACRLGAQVIIMDDGFQNPSLVKDLSLVVIDAAMGFGNGLVLPAGPLREPVARGLARADAIVLLGEGSPRLSDFAKPVLRARLRPDPAMAETLRGQTILAFAGIGRPAKFFETLVALGATLAEAVCFPDHHVYAEAEIAALKARARGRPLVTTEKDLVRLGPPQRAGILSLPVTAVFEDEAALARLLDSLIFRASGPKPA